MLREELTYATRCGMVSHYVTHYDTLPHYATKFGSFLREFCTQSVNICSIVVLHGG